MRTPKFFLTLLAALMSFSAFAAGGKPSVYDRVMEKRSIRCGYFSWYPSIIKDPATGEFKGIFYDYMSELGKLLSLKIEWAEEIGLGDFPAALESGRIDAMCGGAWGTAEKARTVDFVEPVYYLPLYAFARTDDFRFDKDLSILNNKNYKMAVLEGGATSTLRRFVFPEAQALELPSLASPSELFVSLAQGKADAIIYDPFTFHVFDENNPGKVRMIGQKPVRIFSNVVAVARGQEEFRRMLDNATKDMLLSGTIEKIVAKYEKYPGILLRPAKSYLAPVAAD
ncbi:MAG: transporter substrate-binding domain-containing protein [Alphaproteobacteria bacterium]|nr:transporter substrate-binding domain-containing protein [Alphaproteobacteria bacterium]